MSHKVLTVLGSRLVMHTVFRFVLRSGKSTSWVYKECAHRSSGTSKAPPKLELDTGNAIEVRFSLASLACLSMFVNVCSSKGSNLSNRPENLAK